MTKSPKTKLHFHWVDALKAFAILGILLNHLVEEFSPGPWFTNPSDSWPDLATRLHHILPPVDSWPLKIGYFIGWLGDSGPGVFILLSGFGLTLSALQRGVGALDLKTFYRKRISRIFPLYVAIHLLTLAGQAFIPGNEYTFAHPYTLLSLLGLRFSDSLFFYLNPSWWFIWTILQLYLVFPLLYLLLKRLRLFPFLGLMLALTVLSRGMGLLGLRYSDSLYYWMTGIFFGTRLAEFAFGMALAVVVIEKRHILERYAQQRWRVSSGALLIYTVGLLASFFWWGTLVSNLLVTIGLSGLFYAAWEGLIRKRLNWLSSGVLWIGATSFGVFLFHQAPLKWTGAFFQGLPHLLAAGAVILLSFPFCMLIERTVAVLQRRYVTLEVNRGLAITGAILALTSIASWKFVLPGELSIQYYQLSTLFIGVILAFLLALEFKIPARKYHFLHFLLGWALVTGVIKLYLMPSGSTILAMMIAFATAFLVRIISLRVNNRVLHWGFGMAAMAVFILGVEGGLRYLKPLETPVRWGEYPALQEHPTRVYGLKPNLEIRLRYNNYDYWLRTNSYGLPGPEPAGEEAAGDAYRILIIGDAFSMPEGIAYERSYPALLERKLQDVFPFERIEVIDAGITGYGPNEQLPQLLELLPEFKPDLVLYQFFINEFLEIQLSREDRLTEIGLLSPWSRIEEYVYNSQFVAYAGKLERNLKNRLRKGASGYNYEKTLLGFYERRNTPCYGDAIMEKMERAIHQMKSACDGLSTDFMVLYVPGQAEVSLPADIAYFPQGVDLSDTTRYDLRAPLGCLRRITDKLDVELVDLAPYLKTHPAQPVYFRESWHWNLEGHQVVAEAIFEELQRRNYLAKQ